MIRRIALLSFCAVILGAIFVLTSVETQAQETQQAYGRQWGRNYNPQDWNRFYHYPYVYYPHNYYPQEYFRSAPNLYHRYPAEMQIPTYNPSWANFYPSPRRYHQGKHFILDVH